MRYLEHKTDEGYRYENEDVFGKITIESTEKLDGLILDNMVGLILRENTGAKLIEGTVKHSKGIVKYTFEKIPAWEDDDEEKPKEEDKQKEEPCENLPTSTKEPEKEYTQTKSSPIRILSWCRRFAEAFREAWKKSKN